MKPVTCRKSLQSLTGSAYKEVVRRTVLRCLRRRWNPRPWSRREPNCRRCSSLRCLFALPRWPVCLPACVRRSLRARVTRSRSTPLPWTSSDVTNPSTRMSTPSCGFRRTGCASGWPSITRRKARVIAFALRSPSDSMSRSSERSRKHSPRSSQQVLEGCQSQ
jgi:hypothetical protein